MFGFFGGFIKAGYYTLSSLSQGKPNNFGDIRLAQKNRMNSVVDLMSNLNYSSDQITARKQYWHSQVLFLATFLAQVSGKIDMDVQIHDKESLSKTIDTLLTKLDEEPFLQNFLSLLEESEHSLPVPNMAEGLVAELEEQQHTVKKGDVIEEVKRLAQKGYFVIVNDAANSHRDGAAKYSKGSLEELFSRFTDQAIKLVLHFENVHQRNADKDMSHVRGSLPQMNVDDYKQRYLKMILTIMSNLIKNERYLESPQFFTDLFNSFPSADGLPIYFDMQNNAYEVPVDGGFFSSRLFKDTATVKTMDTLLEHLESPSYPIGVASFAAPDLRVLETKPLDTRATSNRILANPTAEGTLGYMIDQGISFQCEQAIAMAKKSTQPVHVLFVLPGCGAFKNPEKIAAAHFVSTIKYYEEEFAANNISFNIVEYNTRLADLLDITYRSVGKELCELNKAIHQTKNPLIKNRAIAVRESILSLYSSGNDMTDLIPLINTTTNLLLCKPEDKASMIAGYKQLAENFHKQPDDFSHNLHAAMIKFVSGIARIFGIAHLDKDAAFKDSANELINNLSETDSTLEDRTFKF